MCHISKRHSERIHETLIKIVTFLGMGRLMWGGEEIGKEIFHYIYIYVFYAFYNFCTWKMYYSFHRMSLSPRSQGASWMNFLYLVPSVACD